MMSTHPHSATQGAAQNSGSCTSIAVSGVSAHKLMYGKNSQCNQDNKLCKHGERGDLVMPANFSQTGFPSVRSMQTLPCCARMSTCIPGDCTPAPHPPPKGTYPCVFEVSACVLIMGCHHAIATQELCVD